MRGLGHLQAPRDPRDWRLAGLLGVPSQLPSSVDLSPRIDAIKDQGQTEACVAFALARGIQLRAAVAGTNVAYPSEMAIYGLGRDMPLVDSGSYPRQVASALISYGTVPNERWPFDPSKINQVPPWDVMQHGADARLTGYYFLDDGPTRAQQARVALASGYPVPFAQQVASDFMNYAGGVLDVTDLPVVGGHMTCLVGYLSDGSFLGVNSWGLGFGEKGGAFTGGFFRITEARLNSDRCSDALALTVSPAGES